MLSSIRRKKENTEKTKEERIQLDILRNSYNDGSMNTTNQARTSTTSRRTGLLLALILLMLCCLGGGWFFLQTYRKNVSTQEIYTVLELRADALRRKDLAQYLACFSTAYRSQTQSYEELKADAARWFEQFEQIRFAFQVLDIQLERERAIVENQYKFFLTNLDGETLELAQRELLEIRRENDAWKITQSLSVQ